MTSLHIPTDKRYQHIDQSLEDTAEVIRRAKQMINRHGKPIVESRSIGMVVPVSQSVTYLNISYNVRIQQSTHSSKSTIMTNQCVLHEGQFLRPSVFRGGQPQLQPSFSFGSLKPPNINGEEPGYPQEDQNNAIKDFKDKLNEVYPDSKEILHGDKATIPTKAHQGKYKDEQFIGRIVHDTNKSTASKKVRFSNSLERQFASSSSDGNRSRTIDHEEYFSSANRDFNDTLAGYLPNNSSNSAMRIEQPAQGQEILAVEPIPQIEVKKPEGPSIPQINIHKNAKPFFKQIEIKKPQTTDGSTPTKKTNNQIVYHRYKDSRDKFIDSLSEKRGTHKTPDRTRFKIDKRKNYEESTETKIQESSKVLQTEISRSIQMRRLSDLGNSYKDRMRQLQKSRSKSRSSHTILFNRSLKTVVSDCDQSQYQSSSIMCPSIQSCINHIECPKFRKEVEKSIRQRFLLRFSYLYSEKYIDYDELFDLYNKIRIKQIPEYRWEDLAKELMKKKQLTKTIRKSANASRYTTIV